MTADVQTQQKHDTQKLFSIAEKTLKAAEAYLDQHRKLDEAFVALEVEREKMEQEHKEILTVAGSAEASRLLGETPAISPKTLDASLMRVRDQQGRMVAAKQGLSEKKHAMFATLESQAEEVNVTLSGLARSIEHDLNEELKQAVAQINSIVNRYYALYSAARYGSLYKRQVFEMKIPSLVDGENLFREPARYHVRTNEVLASAWKDDEAAVKLHERVAPIGTINQRLQSMEKSFLDRGGLTAL